MDAKWFDAWRALPPRLRDGLQAAPDDLLSGWSWFTDFSDLVDGVGTPAWLCVGNETAALVLPLARLPLEPSWLGLQRVQSLANWYSLRWRPLSVGLDAAGLSTAWRVAARALHRHRFARIELGPIRPDDAWWAAAEPALRHEGFRLAREDALVNWTSRVEGLGFDAWFARRPGQLRNTWKRRGAQLARAGRLACRIVGAGAVGPGELDAALDAYERVYAASWKPAESHPAFMRALAHRAAALGALRLGVLHLDGEPIAAQMWFVEQGRATIYKLAYDERHKALSPGLFLTVEMFRQVIDRDRVGVLDYGSGDDAYKADWMTERGHCARLVAHHPATPGGALLLARQAWRRRGSL